MAFRLNPLNGQLELDRSQANVEFAQKISSEFICNASTAVGDVVVPSQTVENKVITITTNIYNNLVFGIVIKKIDATTCEVLVSGKVTDGISGLSFGKVAYIGPFGTITTTVPTTGHLQKIGMAIKANELFLLPSLEKIILS